MRRTLEFFSVNENRKMRPLLPSLKEKKRYLVFEVISKDRVSGTSLKKVVVGKTKDFFGSLFLAKAGFQFIKSNNNKFLVRIGHKFVDHLKSSLSLVTKVDDKSVILNTVTVSGILKKAELKGGF